MFASQIVSKLVQFRADYVAKKFATIDEVIDEFQNIIQDLSTGAHRSLTKYEPVVQGEPPSSIKMNRFWRGIQHDMNNIDDQLMALRANALFLHNFYATEIEKARNLNAQASNKLKTLQLYASAHDPDVVTFGDYFRNQDFIDTSLVATSALVSLDVPGQISLNRSGEINNLTKESKVTILPTSNGFLGNNQEIEDPPQTLPQTGDGSSQSANQNASSTGVPYEPLYKPNSPLSPLPDVVFVAQTDRHAKLESITDQDPTTWIEYESNFVSKTDKESADNLNFVYKKEATEGNPLSTTNDPNATYVDWANGPPGGVLKLDLEFDLEAVKTINRISFTPFGLKGDINYPIKIAQIQVSETGTDWIVLNPQNVYLGTDVNLRTANTAPNVSIGVADWLFVQQNVQFIRISVEQAQPVDSNVGHLFFLKRSSDIGRAIEVIDLTQPSGVRTIYPTTGDGTQRVEGPIPLVNDPTIYYKGNNLIDRGGYTQQAEFFKGKRWAIGVRDILVQEVKYGETSTMISKEFNVNGIVDRVSLEADLDIPEGFDTTQTWIKFYVSPDNGVNWFQISRIQDDFLAIPEIIAFNDPLPSDFRELGIDYHGVPNTVTSLRVKVEISRPSSKESSSPVLRSYVLKVRKR